MIRFLSFSSGSCGNACLFVGESGGVLVDAGVSLRRIKSVLEGVGMDTSVFQGIIVTHDHGDHIRHLGSLCKRLSKPVFAPSLLHEALAYHPYCGGPVTACRRDIAPDAWVDVAPGICVHWFPVPHDATMTVGYAIRVDGHLAVLLTDLGEMTPEALRWASEAETVIVESNYDVDMLLGGDYPHELKMRIVRGYGHLSNDACADAIRTFLHPGLRNLFLCHLSGNNNTPTLAYESAAAALRSVGSDPSSLHLRILPRGIPTPLLVL